MEARTAGMAGRRPHMTALAGRPCLAGMVRRHHPQMALGDRRRPLAGLAGRPHRLADSVGRRRRRRTRAGREERRLLPRMSGSPHRRRRSDECLCSV